MKKVTLALAVATVLSACSNSDNDTTATETAAPEAEATTQAVEAAPAPDAAANTDTAPAAAPVAASPAGPLASPESIAVYDGKLYISNVGPELKPTERDGDGFIAITDMAGSAESASKMELDAYLHAPKGMLNLNGTLYVTDLDYIYGFLLEDNSLMSAVKPGDIHPEDPQPLFLNDLAQESDTSFFVSATDTGVLYRITESFAAPEIQVLDIAGDIKGPNGMTFDAESNTLYVVGFGTNNEPNGEIGKIDLSTTPHQYSRLGDHAGYLDGLAKVGNKLIFSDWIKFEEAGHIMSYDLESGAVTQLTQEPIAGPADFIVSEDGSSLIVPAMLGNKIVTIPLS